ncbi:WD40 repeat domain-containing protein [Cytobacillus dafuensis]|uniref:WD40 repeat domain-containing protein n=1 Tax=Cytobacillus dafuensis TaxID=1742359 RepID=A0A5B8ZCY9_CYTDA|nr:WD40 repeat domain-containing protein [Cytobacillus dafuensis]QED49649.1 WD40 repeat domain-containing protein [Cytobacillus dafuensis]
MKKSWLYISFICLFLISFQVQGESASAASKITKIGKPITNSTAITASSGNDAKGNALMYVILQGEPAQLVVFDIFKKTLVDQKVLTGSSSGWAIETDGKGEVWIGGTPSNKLYKYNPNQKKLTDVGKATSGSTSIHDIEVDKDGHIYGSTSYEGGLFKYSNGNFQNLGQASKGKMIGRSLAYNPKTHTMFVGVGANADLIAWNLKTNEKKSILPAKYKNITSIYDLDQAGGVLFAKLEKQNKILMFDAQSYKFKGELNAKSRGVSKLSPNGKNVYFTNDYHLQKLDLQTGKITPSKKSLSGTEAVSLDYVKQGGKPFLTGLLGNTGTFFTYDLETEDLIVDRFTLPALGVPIYNLAAGPDGNIYISSYVSEKMGVYHPENKSFSTIDRVGQVEGFAAMNGRFYLGVYPDGKINEINFLQNPYVQPLFTIGNGQDRPVTMTGAPGTNYLYIGTHPKNGEVGGSLTIYDTAKKTQSVRRNLVKDQSIISLTTHQGYVYGGTSIFSGKNIEGKQNAVFFRLKSNSPTGKIEILPLGINKPRMIHALTADDKGKIYGLSDGNFFAYDPQTKKTQSVNVVKNTSGRFRNGSLVIGNDKYIYGTVENTLFRVHSGTFKLEILKSNGAERITKGMDGVIYFTFKDELWKLE